MNGTQKVGAMTGQEHYEKAERLLVEASRIGDDGLLIAATAHAVLALVSVTAYPVERFGRGGTTGFGA